eukprot:CAMPEP_0202903804 /NCGR_PEP_ID=MMETSP1392-20130828/26455_1 /ASSEMBLY_ACC=CAM_ASM_000868 /TAXON_ID=225041 /ORGANISM="Chlamydomonas chlamydogama, Strain SAG 11-48b" /LENGTH=308 /DNA_ID=CAMNT_0049591143 /DNA_START=239 /DNA_END=1162 /DNA_ORIENTATION=+
MWEVGLLLGFLALATAQDGRLDQPPPFTFPANITVLSVGSQFDNISTCGLMYTIVSPYMTTNKGWTCTVQRDTYASAGAPGHFVATLSVWFDFPPFMIQYFKNLQLLRQSIWVQLLAVTRAGCAAEGLYSDGLGPNNGNTDYIGMCTNNLQVQYLAPGRSCDAATPGVPCSPPPPMPPSPLPSPPPPPVVACTIVATAFRMGGFPNTALVAAFQAQVDTFLVQPVMNNPAMLYLQVDPGLGGTMMVSFQVENQQQYYAIGRNLVTSSWIPTMIRTLQLRCGDNMAISSGNCPLPVNTYPYTVSSYTNA